MMKIAKEKKDPINGFEAVYAPLDAELNIQKSERSIWENDIVLWFVAIAMAALDAYFLFDMMDLVMVQDKVLGTIGAVGIALILNLLPLVIAKQINKARYKMDANAKTFAIIAIAIFGILYAAIVILRFHCLELYISEEIQGLQNSVAAGEEMTNEIAYVIEQARRRAAMTALLLSVEPLATSVFSFTVAILTDNPVKKKIDAIEQRLYEIRAGKIRVSAALASMWEDIEFLKNQDYELFEAACNSSVADAERLKAEGRMMLAAKLGDPDSISALSRQDTEEGKDHQAKPAPEIVKFNPVKEDIA